VCVCVNRRLIFLSLVTEFMENGSLFEHLADRSIDLLWPRRLAFARQIADGKKEKGKIVFRSCFFFFFLRRDFLFAQYNSACFTSRHVRKKLAEFFFCF
jgi:hypothetical protein